MHKSFLALLIVSALLFNSCKSLPYRDNSELNKYLVDGNLSFNEGDYNKAKELFSKALEIDNTNEIALNNQILTLTLLNNNSEALDLVNEAIETHPGKLKFLLEKARLLKIQDNIMGAISIYQEVLSIASFEASYHKEYLDFLLSQDFKNNNKIKDLIIDEATYLLNNSINEKEALIALLSVKNNVEYSLLLKSRYEVEWENLLNN